MKISYYRRFGSLHGSTCKDRRASALLITSLECLFPAEFSVVSDARLVRLTCRAEWCAQLGGVETRPEYRYGAAKFRQLLINRVSDSVGGVKFFLKRTAACTP